jgi:hypothetical protein
VSRPHPIVPDDEFGFAAARAGVPSRHVADVLRRLDRDMPDAERQGPKHPAVVRYLTGAARLLVS